MPGRSGGVCLVGPGAAARLQLLRRVALDVEHHLQRDGHYARAEAGQLARDGGCLLGDGEQELERQVARRVFELDVGGDVDEARHAPLHVLLQKCGLRLGDLYKHLERVAALLLLASGQGISDGLQHRRHELLEGLALRLQLHGEQEARQRLERRIAHSHLLVRLQ